MLNVNAHFLIMTYLPPIGHFNLPRIGHYHGALTLGHQLIDNKIEPLYNQVKLIKFIQ